MSPLLRYALLALFLVAAVAAGPIPTQPAGESLDGELTRLDTADGLPAGFAVTPATVLDGDGLHGDLRTVATDLQTKDFTLDVLVKFRDGQRSACIMGLGENGRTGNRVLNSVGVRAGVSTVGGGASLVLSGKYEFPREPQLGKLNGPGPHLFRLAKKGDELTVAVCADYKGWFVPTASQTVANLPADASFLNKTNSALFVSGDAAVQAIRLVVEGQLATPGAKAKPAAAAAPRVDSLTPLRGQAGLPAYLKANPQVYADAEGLHGGTLRTTMTDLIDKDFTFDLVFLAKDQAKSIFLVGLGENGAKSVCSRVHGPGHGGYGTLTISGQPEGELGRFVKAGTHLFRIEKRGNTLLLAIVADFQGKYEPTAYKIIPDLKAVAPFLNKTNSALFVEGDATCQSVRLVIDGKTVDPGPLLPATIAGVGEEVKSLTSLQGQSGLPTYLKANAQATADAIGLRGGEVRSTRTDLLDHDFTFDLQFLFREKERSIFVVGLGENGNKSVCSRVHGPGYGGYATLTISGQPESELGKFLKEGPNLFRIEKKGATLLLAVCVDFQGKFEPVAVKILPDLKTAGPFLTRQNAALFFGGDGYFQAVRLIVDGKPLDPPSALAAGTRPQPGAAALTAGPLGNEDLWRITVQDGLPAYLKASPQTFIEPEGLRGGQVRSTAVDLIGHDFVFDVLFKVKDNEKSIFQVGLGESGRSFVGSRVHGPGYGGYGTLTISGQPEAELGRYVKAGTHLFRLEKKGPALTLAICADYVGKYEPTVSKTLPDVKAVAGFLNATNSAVFIDGSVPIEAVRLWIDGKPAPAGNGLANLPFRALTGPAHLIALASAELPSFLERPRGTRTDAAGLPLKGHSFHTRNADFLEKDFTFDVVYRYQPNEQGIMVVGLGEYIADGNRIGQSVCSRVHGPGFGGYGTVTIAGQPEVPLGPIPGPGPHLFRLQKRANTLTMAVCANFAGTFEPQISKTLPDLKSAAPFLNPKNSVLFFSDGAVVEQVRLVVEGEPIESRDIPVTLPARVVEGKPLALPITAKVTGLHLSFQASPRGASVGPGGQLQWTPGHDQLGLQTFRILIQNAQETLVVPASMLVVSAEDAALAKGDLAKVDDLYRLPLPAESYDLEPGSDGMTLMLLTGDRLQILSGDGLKVAATHQLPQKYHRIRERSAYYVALSDQSKSLDLLDKTTLKAIRSIKMDYPARTDLALHPAKAVCYVAVETHGDGPRHVILEVDEATGDVREQEDFMGQWIKVAPDGTHLYAGYHDIYERGSRLIMNPDRWDVVPEYGSIDLLLSYDITERDPRIAQVKVKAGGNGLGLVLSPDGQRLSYLSHVGYPEFSGNVPGWDPTDFRKRPVSYPTKANGAGAGRISYHPILPLAAAPRNDGAVVFDRETGDVQPKRLDLTYPPLGEVDVNDLSFSPDGRNLLLHCEAAQQHFLRRVKLLLSADETATLDKPRPVPTSAPTAPPADPRFPRIRAEAPHNSTAQL